ncbi:hypothetical protein AN964_00880 [Heyndrickxia shackletonii]|uniref:Uncharacterized protein n=1 Tax=Heyndrickxia shackletonii TaxID=157838 RepID=A0A0Q3WU89_9BACI|nr:helix-turn-helix domain-containing protein [Heyndrickxia shackletonii]KQL52234.1 hypothetical protein AN964_00880 [Heyndrickxia shackletonii]MBB2480832.1 helix-turn-helix domain-containing protein [Bacillus sp. APMAM]NEZ00253.1 helix-turn-helix domain-containing protein [Heyndrickxia shackletonii]RTZ55816.1 helix-turn-helix domain-containing protein [Bacillus sp. SAJ1]
MIKIVIADHDDFEAKGIQWLVESSVSNVSIKVATSLSETILALEQDPPAILVYDMNIGSSESLTRLLKIHEPAMICLTMEATYETAKKAIDIGTKYLLLKPFSPQELLNYINNLIREQHRKRQRNAIHPHPEIKQEVMYEELFMMVKKQAKSYVFIAFQPENTSTIPTLNQFLKDYIFPVSPIIFPLSDMLLCLFKDAADVNWSERCKRFMLDWEQEQKEPVSIIINHDQYSGRSIHERYSQTKKMTEVTFFIGYRQVLEFESPLKWAFIDPFLTPSEQKQWISFLNEGNKEGISQFLTSEFLQFHEPYPDPGLLRIRLTSILAQIRRHMKSANLDSNSYEKEYLDIFDTILYNPLIYRIVQKLIIFTSKLVDAVREKSKSDHLELIDKCLHYMELHFWKPEFDLNELSRYVGRNSTYLSHLFVEKTSSTFRESLTQLRIKEAKRLLEETELAIKEIASLTGFQNQHYFSRVFKKVVGKAPKEYRMEH